MKRAIFFVLQFLPLLSWTQIEEPFKLDYDVFIKRVLEHHPRVYQADIVAQSGKVQVLKAKGAFDPKLEGSMQQKYFNDNPYYHLSNGGLTIPTWFGISAKSGYEQNRGDYLNPMDKVPSAGLWYAGLEIELGKGLLIDKRRAELKQAQLLRQGSEMERQIIRNQLIYEASIAYWDWMNAYFQLQVNEQAVENAKVRLEGVRNTTALGFRPSIDTVEASIQWQTRRFAYNQVKMELVNAREKLQLYLWEEGFIPLEISNAKPVKVESNQIASLFNVGQIVKDSVLMSHPYAKINNLKLQHSIIELRMKKEQLKPGLTLKYNALSEPIGKDPFTNYSPSNYAWGAKISYPLLSRKERGDVQLSQLKIEDQKLTNVLITAEIEYQVDVMQNKFYTAIDQLQLIEQTVFFYEQLYNAEKQLFDAGESSLFMINSREKAYLDAQLKLVELLSKAMVAGNELNYKLMIGNIQP